MGILDDTAIFSAVIQQGGFSHAAKHLGLSNGMVSRRIAQLEASLGVTLLKRTTRQLHLTPEGEVFWQHAQRIQQEMDSAVSLISLSAKKPKGAIRVSAPLFFGREYLTPIIAKFLNDFADIKVDLMLTNELVDPIKQKVDFMLRGSGYVDDPSLQDSSMKMKLLVKEEIGLYASTEYLINHDAPQSPQDLLKHSIIGHSDNAAPPAKEKWPYLLGVKEGGAEVSPNFTCNDVESRLIACLSGYGIGRFTDLNVKPALQKKDIKSVLPAYDWGSYHLYAVYPQQKSLPQRTRLLLDFIVAHTQNLQEKIG